MKTFVLYVFIFFLTGNICAQTYEDFIRKVMIMWIWMIYRRLKNV